MEPSRWAMCNPMRDRDKIDNDRDEIESDRETKMNVEEEIRK